MNEVEEKYLPVGTVVMLKGGSKRVMIAGFCAMSEEGGEKVYDYSGCLYPEGFISSTQTCLFDHEQIDKVYFKGFVDEEEIEFKKKLAELIKQINNSGMNSLNTQQPVEEIVPESQTESDDDLFKNFPGPVDDVMKSIQDQNNEQATSIEDNISSSNPSIDNSSINDDFLKSFPGPIDDVMKAMNEKSDEASQTAEVSDVGTQSLNNNPTQSQTLNENPVINEEVPTIEF